MNNNNNDKSFATKKRRALSRSENNVFARKRVKTEDNALFPGPRDTKERDVTLTADFAFKEYALLRVPALGGSRPSIVKHLLGTQFTPTTIFWWRRHPLLCNDIRDRSLSDETPATDVIDLVIQDPEDFGCFATTYGISDPRLPKSFSEITGRSIEQLGFYLWCLFNKHLGRSLPSGKKMLVRFPDRCAPEVLEQFRASHWGQELRRYHDAFESLLTKAPAKRQELFPVLDLDAPLEASVEPILFGLEGSESLLSDTNPFEGLMNEC